MFRNCTNFNGDVSQWDVSSISNFSLAFVEVAAFAGDLTLWDVSGATNMQSMLSAPAFPSQDLSGWDVSGVTNMQEMFRDTNFNSASITGWDVGSVSNMIGMFRGSNDFDQDISGWDFSSVTSMSLFLSDGALSTANYDALLISLAGQTLQSGVNFHAGSSMYSAGAPADARASIISTYGWTIADGGPA
jgi:surface protein